MSVGRGAMSLGIGFLVGTFVSAFVAMIAETVGTPVDSGWLALIVLVVVVGGFYPTYRLVWRWIPARRIARPHEEAVTASRAGMESDD